MTFHISRARRGGATLLVCTMAAAVIVMSTAADAAIVPRVPLATSAAYSVLAGSAVTNTGPTTMDKNLGVSPGSAISGFPPGLVNLPGVLHPTPDAAVAQAQSDLTAAYVNAAGRPIDFTETADLGNKTLQAGVYQGPAHGAISITGPLVLDGAGNRNSVFIFQTNSTLITASASTVTLINGAQECNVFWQIGSSATLGTGSVFSGNILALSSITVTTGVTVHGRALARNGAVTLDTDTFVSPTCQVTPTAAETAAAEAAAQAAAAQAAAAQAAAAAGVTGSVVTATPTSSGVPGVTGAPRTGGTPMESGNVPMPILLVLGLVGFGTAAAALRRRSLMRTAAVER